MTTRKVATERERVKQTGCPTKCEYKKKKKILTAFYTYFLLLLLFMHFNFSSTFIKMYKYGKYLLTHIQSYTTTIRLHKKNILKSMKYLPTHIYTLASKYTTIILCCVLTIRPRTSTSCTTSTTTTTATATMCNDVG